MPCGHLLVRADLLALVGDVYCIFVNFPCGILGQVWYLIESFPDLCCLSYFVRVYFKMQVTSILKQGYRYHKFRKAFHGRIQGDGRESGSLWKITSDYKFL